MLLILKREWPVCNGLDRHAKSVIPIGQHEVELIRNPFGYLGYWIVLKGTQIGASEGSWRQWEGEQWEDFEVVVKYDYEISSKPIP